LSEGDERSVFAIACGDYNILAAILAQIRNGRGGGGAGEVPGPKIFAGGFIDGMEYGIAATDEEDAAFGDDHAAARAGQA
jgi:hypothetical protein